MKRQLHGGYLPPAKKGKYVSQEDLFENSALHYKCCICLEVVAPDAFFETNCGHFFCNTHPCAPKIGSLCPLDRQQILSFSQSATIKRELTALKVKCPNEACPWKGERVQFEQHSNSCPFEQTPCKWACNSKVTRANLQAHEQTCVNRRIHCEFCKDTYLMANKQVIGVVFFTVF